MNRTRLICLEETGFLMGPVLRRTWAPRGQPPLLPPHRGPGEGLCHRRRGRLAPVARV